MQRGIISCTIAEAMHLAEIVKTIPPLTRLQQALSQPFLKEPVIVQMRADEVETILDHLPPPQASGAIEKNIRVLLTNFLQKQSP